MKVINQKMMAIYYLYKSYRENKERFVPTWEFMGEMYIEELDRWVLMSYKVPTRLSDIYQDNPGLLERKKITGKSGSEYYGYRFSQNVNKNLIRDKKLIGFYAEIRQRI